MSRLKDIIFHTVFWFFLFGLLIAGGILKPVHHTILSGDIRDIQLVSSWIMVIAFVYFHHFYLVPNFYLKKKYLFYAASVAFSILIIFTISEGIDPNYSPPPEFRKRPDFSVMNNMRMKDHALHLFLIIIFALGSLYYHLQTQIIEAQKDNVTSELNNLKNQIQPHFLFNTLNSIYALSFSNSEQTAEAILQLSNFLRYLFKEGNTEWVKLQHEIDYLENYIKLQRWRFDKTVTIHYRTQGEAGELMIAPLLFMTYVENAFHYGVSPEEPSEIDIKIFIDGDEIQVSVKNKKVKNIHHRDVSGVGQDITKKRLDLLYPNHQLHISEDDHQYKIVLNITLYEPQKMPRT